MRRFARLFLASTTIVFFAAAAHADTLTIASGSGVFPALVGVQKGFEAESKVSLKHLKEGGLGADSVLLAVDSGSAEVGLIGNSWDRAEALVKAKGLTLKGFSKMKHKVLGEDKLVIVTYKGGPAELSKEQIKKLLTGKALNWKDVGGEDAPVQIFTPVNTPANQKLIVDQLLDGEDIYRKGIKNAADLKELTKVVGSTKGAISFGVTSADLSGLNVPKQEGISKPVVAVTLGEPSANSQKFIDYFQKNYGKK